jgi:hypothetical protein
MTKMGILVNTKAAVRLEINLSLDHVHGFSM